MGLRCGTMAAMVPEAPLEQTEAGRVPKGDGWFVLNARDARWRPSEGRGAYCVFEGELDFPQLGIHLVSLEPGEPMAMYHWEADQEDFLVLSGEALLIIEGEERPLAQWDFVHCPAHAKHVILGAGSGRCLVLAVGARQDSVDGPNWGGYTRRRGRVASRRRRRGGDHRAVGCVCAIPAPEAGSVSRGLAPRLGA